MRKQGQKKKEKMNFITDSLSKYNNSQSHPKKQQRQFNDSSYLYYICIKQKGDRRSIRKPKKRQNR